MTHRQKKSIRRAALVAGALALFVPITVSPSQGVDANNACADGTCCRELMSICVGEDSTSTLNWYNDADGVCGLEEQN